jgi:hypothetical protein
MIYWTVLMERSLGEHAVDALLDVATFAGYKHYVRLSMFYTRVDVARNAAVQMFRQPKEKPMMPNSPDDYLVMLDADHAHPHDILVRLTAHNLPVVCALAFRRAEPFDPLIFNADGDGKLKRLDVWTGGLMRMDAVGFGAVAIRRDVFNQLEENGYKAPFFRFDYRLNDPMWSFGEDLYFCELCKNSGVPVHCDTSVVTPHLTVYEVKGREWVNWLAQQKTPVETMSDAGVKFAPVEIKTQVPI